jgi:hypothetical protein
MVTDAPIGWRRRDCLAAGALILAGSGAASSPLPARLFAAWATGSGDHRVGVLQADAGRLEPCAQLEVPTRAHGLLDLGAGDLLAIARRPGDWLLRWSPASGRTRWTWVEPDRAFNGHAVLDDRRLRLYTSEMRLDTGDGLVGVRDAATLEKLAEWPTGGRDPHQLALDGEGRLMVANGGLHTLPESGRRKLSPQQMDSSLVCLDPQDGEVLGQWRLADRKLGLRHLAWGRSGSRRVLGIALQAEHDDPAERHAAPVLALFDGDMVRAVPAPQALAGYGGDIAHVDGVFAIGCPRAGGFAMFGADGDWRGWQPLPQACALSPGTVADRWWAAGATQALACGARRVDRFEHRFAALDNHWTTLRAPA